MRAMRSKLVTLLILVVIACASNATSPAGPVGKPIDLRSHITNAEVAARAPADDKATVREHVEIQGSRRRSCGERSPTAPARTSCRPGGRS
jgi:hypothetical protein